MCNVQFIRSNNMSPFYGMKHPNVVNTRNFGYSIALLALSLSRSHFQHFLYFTHKYTTSIIYATKTNNKMKTEQNNIKTVRTISNHLILHINTRHHRRENTRKTNMYLCENYEHIYTCKSTKHSKHLGHNKKACTSKSSFNVRSVKI